MRLAETASAAGPHEPVRVGRRRGPAGRASLGEALAIQSRALGESHPHTAYTMLRLGFAYGSQGNYSLAIEYFTKALAIQTAALGESHPDTAFTMQNIGAAYGSQGNHSLAIEYYTKALAIRRAALGESHPDTARTASNLQDARQRLAQVCPPATAPQCPLRPNEAPAPALAAFVPADCMIPLFRLGRMIRRKACPTVDRNRRPTSGAAEQCKRVGVLFFNMFKNQQNLGKHPSTALPVESGSVFSHEPELPSAAPPSPARPVTSP